MQLKLMVVPLLEYFSEYVFRLANLQLLRQHVSALYLDGMIWFTIYTYMNQYGTKWNSIMAYGVLLILPCCIIFLTMQKHIVEGMTSGSVKG